MTARQTALSALIACRKQGAWSDGILKDYIGRDRLDRRDAALCSRLCYGVLQNRMLLDYYLQQHLNCRIATLQPMVLDILRLGAYQIVFLEKVPDSAAVNESVELAKKYTNKKAAGLVNGVLRSLARDRDKLAPPRDWETRYSHPAPLVALMKESVGKHLEQVLQADNETPRTFLQVNTLKTTAAALSRALQEQGADCEHHPWLKDCLVVSGTGSVELLPSFRNGEFYVQDPAARLAALAAEPEPGMSVLDVCAAPGGKSFAAAIAMGNDGTILSCDLHAHKIALMDKGVARLGITCMETVCRDAQVYNEAWAEAMDVVIADVPCSGFGIIRKKPDIRYKNVAETEGLPELQLEILRTASRYVKPGGVLIYSTCTILQRENEEVVRAFLFGNGHFRLEPMELPLQVENDGMLTLLPGVYGTDGFFISRLRRLP